MDIFQTSQFWALAGVALGFALSSLWEILRERLALRRKTKAIDAELKTNLGLIPQKIDHLANVQKALKAQAIVPGQNVHCATFLYDAHIGEVGYTLSQPSRESLHVIYESMKVIDRFLDDLFSDFIQSKASGQIAHPFEAYASMCSQLIERARLVNDMISEHLKGHPRKVTWG